jgi:hypothetical protein
MIKGTTKKRALFLYPRHLMMGVEIEMNGLTQYDDTASHVRQCHFGSVHMICARRRII